MESKFTSTVFASSSANLSSLSLVTMLIRTWTRTVRHFPWDGDLALGSATFLQIHVVICQLAIVRYLPGHPVEARALPSLMKVVHWVSL